MSVLNSARTKRMIIYLISYLALFLTMAEVVLALTTFGLEPAHECPSTQLSIRMNGLSFERQTANVIANRK